jgi:hypothetical protein
MTSVIVTMTYVVDEGHLHTEAGDADEPHDGWL